MNFSKHVDGEYLHEHTSLFMERFAAGSARGLIEAQKALDDRARESLISWEQDGIPPSAWNWAECRLRFPVMYELEAKTALADHTALSIAPCKKGAAGRVSLTIRYLPAPQEEEAY